MPKRLPIIAQSVPMQKEIAELHKTGHSYREISALISKQYNKQVGFMTIKHYLDGLKGKRNVMDVDQKLNDYARQQILDVGKSLEDTHKILWALIEGNKNVTKQFKLSVIREILKAIKTCDEMTRDFRHITLKQSLTINTQGVNSVQFLMSKLHELEQRGDIKILNPRFKQGNTIDAEVVDNLGNKISNDEIAEEARKDADNIAGIKEVDENANEDRDNQESEY